MKVFRKAFTLAEVLITLGIIGVVAAMTIPTLTKNIQEKQFQVAAKKAFADINQAYKMLQATDSEFTETVCRSDITDYCYSQTFGENFKLLIGPFKAKKTCFSNNASKCWECAKGQAGLYSSTEPDYLGCTNSSYSFIDSSGRAWYMYQNGERTFLVDTNGFLKPNKIGADRWAFKLPMSMRGRMISPYQSENYKFKNRTCPSGDCKYGKVFFNK